MVQSRNVPSCPDQNDAMLQGRVLTQRRRDQNPPGAVHLNVVGMPDEQAFRTLELFAQRVAPQFAETPAGP